MSLTRSRTLQYIGILLALITIAAGYWYFAVRAGVKTNSGAVQPQGTDDLSAGLAGYWKLDENTGTSIADASTNARSGTLTNSPTWTTGQIGSGVQFDGTNDYASIPSVNLTSTDKITVSFWLNISSYVDGDSAISHGADWYTDGGFTVIPSTSAGYCSAGQSYIAYIGNGGQTEKCYTRPSTGWHLWTAIYDASQPDDDEVVLYLDGTLASQLSVNSNTNTSWHDNLTLYLMSSGGTSNFLAGTLDEVRVYDRRLSPDEITALYRLTTPTGVDTSLKGYWSFNSQDVIDDIAYDWSGAGNTATLNGGPTKTIGRVGQALSFDGTNDYVTMGSPANLDNLANMTLCIWANQTVGGGMITKDSGPTGWYFGAESATQRIVFYAGWTTAPGYAQWVTADGTLPLGQWKHVCVTYNHTSTASDPVIYINGVSVLVTEVQAPAGTQYDDSAMLVNVGSFADGSNILTGQLDEARIYNRILSASEIKSLYDLSQSDKTNTSASQPQGNGNLDSGLAGYWKLDENTGTSAADASTNAITAGTLTNGPTWTTGQIGSAVDFDGTDDYITVPDNDTLDRGDTDDITITGWFNRDTFTTIDVIAAKRAGSLAAYTGYMVFVEATDELRFELSDGTDEYMLVSTSTFTTSGWNHFAVVWDQDSAANAEIYINGRADIATDTPPGGGISAVGNASNAQVFAIGTLSDGTFPFDGKLDEIRVYDRALSAEEIANIYRLTTPTGVDTSLKGYWSFNAKDADATTAYDRSGAGNDGTLTGSPTKVIGRLGQGMEFGYQVAKYVEVGQGNGITDLSQKTACAWINPVSYGSSAKDSTIFSRSRVASGGWLFQLADDDAGIQSLYFGQDFSVADGNFHTPAGSITLNQWQHVCVAYDSSSTANDAVFYINGITAGVTEHSTPSGTVTAEHASLSKLYIGDMVTDTASSFDGKIDEARLYNRILSAAEVKSLYDLGQSDKTNTSVSQPQGTGNLDSGLSSYWKLDENTGTSASDTSTNANTGTLTNGPTWTTGQIGSAVTFDGTNDEITVTNNQGTAANLKTLTLSAWFKTSTASGKKLIGLESSQTGTGSGSSDRLLWMGTDGKIRFGIYTSTTKEAASTATLNDNLWHHAVGVSTGDNGTMYLYIDGALQGTTSLGGTIFTYTNSYWRIGGYRAVGWTNAADGYFTGQLDEVRVYNRPLSADEVSQLYRLATPTGTDTSLKGYWSFNGQDMSGTTAYDRSGAGNTGTLTNGPTKTIGKLGQALDFDGTNDYVDAGSADILDDMTQKTVCQWIYPETIPATFGQPVSKSENNGWDIELTDNDGPNRLEYYQHFTGDFGSWKTPAGSVPFFAWTHACVSYDNSSASNDPVIYLNGVSVSLEEILTPTGTRLSDAGSSFHIGTFDGSNEFFDGKIDEVRIYNRILSAAEVLALYNQSR